MPDETTGILPLRAAIRSDRRDLVCLLLRHGASPGDSDREGMVIREVMASSKPGSLALLTDLLETCDTKILRNLLNNGNGKDTRIARYSMKYWVERAVGKTPSFSPEKLTNIGLPRLNALKYRVVGQDFALENVLSEISSHYVNSELSSKPLVLLFSGPPGHGKTETAKQLADLLEAPYWKVDCRNHAHPWEMFGSAAGFVGSELGSPLGNFISENNGKRSVVLLDEFDHCDTETWEGFYHIFDEGEYTYKKVGRNGQYSAPGGGDRIGTGSTSSTTENNVQSASTSRNIDCSKTIFFLTTNRFDDDIEVFNSKFKREIDSFRKQKASYDYLRTSFDAYIRPKLRGFFKGGLTRRIDSVVPFFTFDEEEAYVVADMYVDFVRRQYMMPPSRGRHLGNLHFDITDAAVAELSKGYVLHSSDGASAIKREIYAAIIKKLHMRWLRDEKNKAISISYGSIYDPLWFHVDEDIFNKGSRNEAGRVVMTGEVSKEHQDQLPYFVDASENKSVWFDTIERTLDMTDHELLSILQEEEEPQKLEEPGEADQIDYYQNIYDSMEEYIGDGDTDAQSFIKNGAATYASNSMTAEDEIAIAGSGSVVTGSKSAFQEDLDYIQNIYNNVDTFKPEDIEERPSKIHDAGDAKTKAEIASVEEEMSQCIDINLFFDGVEETPIKLTQFVSREDTMSRVLEALCAELKIFDDARLWHRVHKSEDDKTQDVEEVVLSMLSAPENAEASSKQVYQNQMITQFVSNKSKFSIERKTLRAITGDLADVDKSGWQLIRDPMGLRVYHVTALQSLSGETKDHDFSWQTQKRKDGMIWKFHPNFFITNCNKVNLSRQNISPPSIDLLVETKQGKNTDFERWPRDIMIQAWREDLATGDIVDVESKAFGGKMDVSKYPSWIEGYVESVGNEVQIRAIGTYADKSIYMTARSSSIQPLYSMSENWRKNINIGNEIDIRISKSLWVVGTVVNISSCGEDEKEDEDEDLHISVGGNNGNAIKLVKRYSEEIVELGRNS